MRREQASARVCRAAVGAVRIIGGEWRSRRITFPATEQIRPTPDRVRETLFNWLGQQLQGMSCLDLFAGSGALGLEAASRGAARVTLVDKNPRIAAALQDSKRMLGADQVNVVKADALEFLKRDQSIYDLVFVDPPFADGPPAGLMRALAGRLSGTAMVYYECGQAYEPPSAWRILKQGRAGLVHFHLLQVA
ncbi:MAG: 16S rRNA (guanine(966)-N(2))-methyltransferase RsmD [Betaproteobacteria bacterium]|nr:16S rRNA (guanine(966)-N(2))-methyltransferase RsmD [Betaproteobacteria bacterium]